MALGHGANQPIAAGFWLYQGIFNQPTRQSSTWLRNRPEHPSCERCENSTSATKSAWINSRRTQPHMMPRWFEIANDAGIKCRYWPRWPRLLIVLCSTFLGACLAGGSPLRLLLLDRSSFRALLSYVDAPRRASRHCI